LVATYTVGDGVLCCSRWQDVPLLDLGRLSPIRRPAFFHRQRRNPGWYWAATTEDLVPYESRLELAHLLHIDFDQDVVDIRAQPFRLHWEAEGRRWSHVPDYLLSLRAACGYAVVDVTVAERCVGDRDLLCRLAATKEACRRLGWDYRLLVDAPARMLHMNLQLLASCRQEPWGYSEFRERLLARATEPIELAELEGPVGPTALVRPTTLHLMWSHQLDVDLLRPLTGRSVVERRGSDGC
jgi:hypothetical protein